MSETPQKSYYQAKLGKLAAALTAWKKTEVTGGTPLSDASALEDALYEHGLQVLPLGPDDGGRWRVLIGGKAAPYLGQSRLSGPVDAGMAAEMFLVAAHGAEQSDREVSLVVRPATDHEQTRHAVFGDGEVYEPTVEVDAKAYVLTEPEGQPCRVLAFIGDDGQEVRVTLSQKLFASLAESIVEEAQGGAR